MSESSPATFPVTTALGLTGMTVKRDLGLTFGLVVRRVGIVLSAQYLDEAASAVADLPWLAGTGTAGTRPAKRRRGHAHGGDCHGRLLRRQRRGNRRAAACARAPRGQDRDHSRDERRRGTFQMFNSPPQADLPERDRSPYYDVVRD